MWMHPEASLTLQTSLLRDDRSYVHDQTRDDTPTHGTIDGRHHRDLHERPPIRHTTTPIHDQSRDDTRPPGESRPREQRHTQDRLISLSASPPQSICHTALPENVTPRGAMIAARDAALDAAVKKTTN